jgi:CheY-like chemotaxis protein
MLSEGRRILYAEPNSDVGELLVLLLEKKGYRITTVQTTAECLALATEEAFDLFIVNDEYCDGDSLELCERLRTLKPQTPLLLFSLDSSGYNHRSAQATKVYVSRTSDFIALVKAIDQLLQRSQ